MGMKKSILFVVAFTFLLVAFASHVSAAPEWSCTTNDDCIQFSLDDTYCSGDTLITEEGVCVEGSCVAQIVDEFSCDNGNYCDGVETCSDAQCVAGEPNDCEAPTCSVDSLEHKDTGYEYDFSDSIYIGERGFFYVFGAAEDGLSKIINVQYNRTSPDYFHSWSGADAQDGAFNELFEVWKSDKDDVRYVDGEHTICCRATDEENNVGEGACQEFCIDTENPETPEVDVLTEFSCVEGYTNDEIEFGWDEVDSNGCAPIAFYEVELYYSNGTLVDVFDEITETSFTVIEPVSGQDYYIKVRAVDAAGNEGSWSEPSEHVWFDSAAPEVDIWGPDGWLNDDFTAYENDTDNLGLYSCEYKIYVVGEGTVVDWTPIDCGLNQPVDVRVPEDCFATGNNACRVYKRVQDYACNYQETGGENGRYRSFDIDLLAPNTTKTVTGPQHSGRFFNWLGFDYLLDLFIKSDTQISFTCDDRDESGCNATYYRYQFNNDSWTSWMHYEGPFAFLDDGVYTLEYYSVDNVGNEEIHQYEIDKVDNEAPTTHKIITGPQYVDSDERLWVNAKTNFTLSCDDSEVGCAWTNYSADGSYPKAFNSSDNQTLTFTLGDLDVETDGEHQVFYSSTDFLDNEEDGQVETDWLDTHFPILVRHNPTDSEAEDVMRCTQSIVVEAFELPEFVGSGLNESSVRAELVNETEDVVAQVSLVKSGDYTYSALMEKELPEGWYTLNIYAKDNVGNENVASVDEYLSDAIYVEYVSPATCNVDAENGGSCDFTMNICMRSGNTVAMWMNKLSGILTPNMIDAMISKDNTTATVGLKHAEDKNYEECMDAQSMEGYYTWDEENEICYYQDRDDLLSLKECAPINGRTNFDFHLTFDSNDTKVIGPGAHKLTYWLESSLDTCDEPVISDVE